MDLAVEALRRLVGASAAKRKEIAAALDFNEQSIYQIVAGVPLVSGRPRTVGRRLREKLDAHYPGWLDASPAAVARPVPSLQEALPVVLAAMVELSPMGWGTVLGTLNELKLHPEYADDARARLLRELQDASGKRRAAALRVAAVHRLPAVSRRRNVNSDTSARAPVVCIQRTWGLFGTP
jgi:hypothetical protein